MKSTRIGIVNLILLCSTILCFLGCEGKPEPRNLIVGKVLEAGTNNPVDSAQIVIADTIALSRVFYTDAAGRYQVNPDTFGVITIYCRKEGYLTSQQILDMGINADVYRNIDFTLNAGR